MEGYGCPPLSLGQDGASRMPSESPRTDYKEASDITFDPLGRLASLSTQEPQVASSLQSYLPHRCSHGLCVQGCRAGEQSHRRGGELLPPAASHPREYPHASWSMWNPSKKRSQNLSPPPSALVHEAEPDPVPPS